MTNTLPPASHSDSLVFAYSSLRRTGNRYLGPDHADDVAQQSFLKTWQNLHKLQHPHEVAPYANQVAAHFSLDNIRRNQRFAAGGLDNLYHDMPRTRAEDPEAKLLVQKALACLNPRQLAVNSLYYFEGYTTAEIGKRLGMSEGHVQVELHRSRRKMRTALLATAGSRAGRS